jgi:hypothetical protein
VRLLKAPDDGIVRIIDFLCLHAFVERDGSKIRRLDKAKLADYCDFLRLYLQKTFERDIVPTAKAGEFIMTVAREMPETVAGDETRQPMVELLPERVEAIIDKADLVSARNEILAECGERSLCRVIAAKKDPPEPAGPGETVTLLVATGLWRQWYLYFLYNGVIPCV